MEIYGWKRYLETRSSLLQIIYNANTTDVKWKYYPKEFIRLRSI